MSATRRGRPFPFFPLFLRLRTTAKRETPPPTVISFRRHFNPRWRLRERLYPVFNFEERNADPFDVEFL